METQLGEELLERLRTRVARSVSRVCPAWLAADADDIVQVAMIKVMRELAHREGNTVPPSSYLMKVAYSATVDEIRRRRRMAETPLEDATEPMTHRAADNPERQAEARRIASSVTECLARLAEPRRLAATLFLQGHTVPEASRLLGWTVKKVENLVLRGMADLRVCLTAKGLKP